MKKRRFLISLIVFFVLVLSLQAQNYKTGVGGRLGFFSGITAKHFIKPTNAVEGIVSFRWDGLIITGLYEWQKPIKEVAGLDWYIGGGAHVGFWDANQYYWKSETSGGFGFDFTIGLEYTFTEAPFSIGLDWKPAFNIIGDSHWWGDGVGLNIRYNFK